MINPEYYNYTFMDILSEHFDINIYHDFLKYQDEYLLKNNWNHLINNWKKIQNYVDKKKYTDKKIKDIYSINYKYIHRKISPKELEGLLSDFISNDKFKAVVVLLSLLELI